MDVRLLLEEPSRPEFCTSELLINIYSCCLELLELICRIRAPIATHDTYCGTGRHLRHGIILLRCDLHENQTRHFCHLYLSTSCLIPSLSLTSEFVSYININSSQLNEILSLQRWQLKTINNWCPHFLTRKLQNKTLEWSLAVGIFYKQ